MATRSKFPVRKESRRNAAAVLHEIRQRRTSAEQLKVLDNRLGLGQGAVKERKRLGQ